MATKVFPVMLENLFFSELMHVGGIDGELGGVDPFADAKLIRLFGFGC